MQIVVDCQNGYKYIIDKEKQLCRINGVGKVNFESSIKTMNTVANDPNFKNGFRILVDLTAINYYPDYYELLGIIEKITSLKNRFKNKIALVTDLNMSVLVHLASIYCENAGMELKYFANEEKALEWLDSSLNSEGSFAIE